MSAAGIAKKLVPAAPHPHGGLRTHPISNSKRSNSLAMEVKGSIRRPSWSHSILELIRDVRVTEGSVVNFERLGSNRKETAISGVLPVICMVPTKGGADRKNCDVNPCV